MELLTLKHVNLKRQEAKRRKLQQVNGKVFGDLEVHYLQYLLLLGVSCDFISRERKRFTFPATAFAKFKKQLSEY